MFLCAVSDLYLLSYLVPILLLYPSSIVCFLQWVTSLYNNSTFNAILSLCALQVYGTLLLPAAQLRWQQQYVIEQPALIAQEPATTVTACR